MPGLSYLSMHLDDQSQAFNIMLFVVVIIVTVVFIGAIVYMIRDSKKH